MFEQGKIAELAQALSYLPTIMTVQQEKLILSKLMALSDEEMLAEEAEFYWILEQLNLSHEYNWLLLAEKDCSVMEKFTSFLDKRLTLFKRREAIEESMFIFSLKP